MSCRKCQSEDWSFTTECIVCHRSMLWEKEWHPLRRMGEIGPAHDVQHVCGECFEAAPEGTYREIYTQMVMAEESNG